MFSSWLLEEDEMSFMMILVHPSTCQTEIYSGKAFDSKDLRRRIEVFEKLGFQILSVEVS